MVPDDGYEYILNYQDCFSKFVILRALKTKTAAEVADCLVNIFFEHSPPSLLQTDNGAEFSNKLLMARKKAALDRHSHRAREAAPATGPGECGAS